MEPLGSAWPQGPAPEVALEPPGAAGGAFPAAFSGSPAFPLDVPGPSPGLATPILEDKMDRSRARKPKSRTRFSPEQLQGLRTIFAGSRYLTPEKGHQLAELLGLSYKQVKTWFQNQRLKAKRAEMEALRPTPEQDRRLPQPEPAAVGARGLGPPSDRPAASSGWSSGRSENGLQHGRGVLPLPATSLEATLGHPSWSYAVTPPWAPPVPQGPPPALAALPSLLENWAHRVQSYGGSEAGAAPRPSPEGGELPALGLLGPGPAAP